jgi:hypothetical protein
LTQFSPIWKVTIAGVDYTDYVMANLTITTGRLNIYEQAQAGYCNLKIYNVTQSAVNIFINDSVSIQLKDSTDTFVPIFGGSVVDLGVTVDQAGSVAVQQSITITALGALSRLPKALTNGVLAKDFDGNQIYDILKEVLNNNWGDVPAALTWATYDPTVQWATAENSGLGEIDRPGNYELANRGSSRIDIYSLVAALATSGLGYLYEDAQGLISYADSTHRTTYLNANGYVELSANEAIASGLSIQTRAGDVRNDITLQYGNASQNEVSATAPASISEFGTLSQIITTTVFDATDAQDQADFYLTLRSQPQANLQAIRYELTNPELSDGDRDSLIGIFMGMPVLLADLPLNMTSGTFLGFVEGWTFSAGYNTVAVEATLSPISYSLQAMRWNDVSITEAWNTISGTLDWQSATVVA